MAIALYLLFFISGAAGLLYESIWSRYLGLFVGHTAYAQIIVLVIFLGGMSLGAMVTGARSARIANPLFAYAVIECIAGFIGLVFHGVYVRVTDFAYATVFPGLAGSVMLTAAKWGLAGLLILPQSILLGATFPLMSAGVLRLTRGEPGRILSFLYFANSFGAAFGVLAAGFYLLGSVGLPGTLVTAGALNLLVAVGTICLVVYARRAEAEDDSGEAAADALAVPLAQTGTTPTALVRMLCFLAFGTAVASFVYEIAWIRMLALVLGSATHSFELMLSAFILGLALGAFWVRSRADRFRDPLRTLGIVQWVMGCLALATLPVYLMSFEWIGGLLRTFTPSDAGYIGFTLSRYVICLTVMLPATFCAGVTLPLITRTLLAKGAGESVIGAVYGWNTLGSIVGVTLAGLILLPAIGLKWMLVIGAAVDMGLGAFILLASAPRARVLGLATAVATVVVAAFAGFGADFSPRLMASGVFRHGKIPSAGELEFLFYEDGRTASVSGYRRPKTRELTIATNGKPDASLGPEWFTACDAVSTPKSLATDAATQTLASLIVLAHAPHPKTAAIIGQGSGMSSHHMLASTTLAKLVTIEIEPGMIEGSRVFYPANRRVFDDPRSSIVIDDAKSYFAATDQRFDIILSEPSNPWVSGVSGLFTTEFYQRIRRYLSEDGIFGQWVHLYEMNDWLVLSVVAAIHQNFPSYAGFLTTNGDMLIVASNRSTLPTPDWSIFQQSPIKDDLCASLPLTPESMEGIRVLDRAALRPLLDDHRAVNSDFFPMLDLGAEKARFLRSVARGFQGFSADRFALQASFTDRRIGFGTSEAVPVSGIPRLEAQALGVTMRAPNPKVSQSSTPSETARREAVFELQLWTEALSAPQPPADWKRWTQNALAIEANINGGTAGVADERFFRDVYAFMKKHAAPPEAWDAIHFRHGLATWNFEQAAEAAARLIPLAAEQKSWVDADELRAGATMSRLRRGDPAGAREALRSLRSAGKIRLGDVRMALLESYVETVAQAQAGSAQRASR